MLGREDSGHGADESFGDGVGAGWDEEAGAFFVVVLDGCLGRMSEMKL